MPLGKWVCEPWSRPASDTSVVSIKDWFIPEEQKEFAESTAYIQYSGNADRTVGLPRVQTLATAQWPVTSRRGYNKNTL